MVNKKSIRRRPRNLSKNRIGGSNNIENNTENNIENNGENTNLRDLENELNQYDHNYVYLTDWISDIDRKLYPYNIGQLVLHQDRESDLGNENIYLRSCQHMYTKLKEFNSHLHAKVALHYYKLGYDIESNSDTNIIKGRIVNAIEDMVLFQPEIRNLLKTIDNANDIFIIYLSMKELRTRLEENYLYRYVTGQY